MSSMVAKEMPSSLTRRLSAILCAFDADVHDTVGMRWCALSIIGAT